MSCFVPVDDQDALLSPSAVLYLGIEAMNGTDAENGRYRSRDGRSSSTLLGTGLGDRADDNRRDCLTSYLDLPIRVEVDPHD